MKLIQINQVAFDTDKKLVCAGIANKDECIILAETGQVFSYNFRTYATRHLFSIPVGNTKMSYTDGGFDIESLISMYISGPAIAVVNDYKRHGYVFNDEKKHKEHLWRMDGNVSITKYPIALFTDDKNIPHIIYGTGENRVEIMNLDTLHILTADKSLIEENAEERYLRFLDHPDGFHTWPRPYDYSYGELMLSPDKKRFMSKGWVWGSSDVYKIYDINDFIINKRIKYKMIGHWEHENRAACWIDNNTIAVAYNPWQEGEDNSTPDAPTELHFIDIQKDDPETVKKFVLDVFDGAAGRMSYSETLGAIIVFTKKRGLFVCDIEGKTLFKDEQFRPDAFYPELNSFITVADKAITVHQLSIK